MAQRVFGCKVFGRTIACNDCVGICPDRNRMLIMKKYINVNASSPYEEEALKIAKLVDEKQIQYGDSFGNAHKLLEVLYPEGISKDKYKDALTVIRTIDKLFRVARGDQGDESAWKDINGYSLLAIVREIQEGRHEP